MGGLLSELGKKLAERWVSLLVLPGVLYFAVAFAAVVLGHSGPFDILKLVQTVTDYAKDPTVRAGGQVALLAGVLGASAAVGLIAQAFGSLWERLVLASGWRSWPFPARRVVRFWVASRRHRWDDHHQKTGSLSPMGAVPPPDVPPHDTDAKKRAAYRRARIAVYLPERPTWSGDRVQAAALRLDHDFHIDLSVVWPHLWLVLPEQPRAELAAARETLSRATTLAAWAFLYLLLVWWWWPAALLALLIALTARHRIRTGADAYALLLEATVRVHATTLAADLGLDHTGPLTPELGDRLYKQLQTRLSP